MRIKLMYRSARELWFTAAALPKYIELEKLPVEGQPFGCKNGIVAEVVGVDETPGSKFQDANRGGAARHSRCLRNGGEWREIQRGIQHKAVGQCNPCLKGWR